MTARDQLFVYPGERHHLAIPPHFAERQAPTAKVSRLNLLHDQPPSFVLRRVGGVSTSSRLHDWLPIRLLHVRAARHTKPVQEHVVITRAPTASTSAVRLRGLTALPPYGVLIVTHNL